MHPDRSLGLQSHATTGRDGTRGEDLLGQAAGNAAAPAFALVVAHYRRDVWDLALRMLRDYHAAEDICQETFCRAYSALGRYDSRGTSKAWLLTICRNLCLDLLRNRRRHPHVQLDDVPEPRCEPSPCEQRIDLRRALAGLVRDELEAVLLVDVLQYRSSEAAKVIGVPASTLRSRVNRARRHLAQELTPASCPAV